MENKNITFRQAQLGGVVGMVPHDPPSPSLPDDGAKTETDAVWRFVPTHDVGGAAVPDYWENEYTLERHYGDAPPEDEKSAWDRIKREFPEIAAEELESRLHAAQRERDEVKANVSTSNQLLLAAGDELGKASDHIAKLNSDIKRQHTELIGLRASLADAEKAKVEAEHNWNRLQRECDLQMNEAHRVGELLKIATTRAETAEAQLADWKTLMLWGGTPDIVHQFIKGQQERIHATQDIEKELEATKAQLAEAKERIELEKDKVSIFAEALRTMGTQSSHASELAKALENAKQRFLNTGHVMFLQDDESGQRQLERWASEIEAILCRYRSAQKENTL